MKKFSGFTCWGILFALALSGCDSSMEYATLDDCPVVAKRVVTATGDTVVVCDPTLVTDTIDLPLSLLVSDLDIVRLENSDEAIIGDGHIWLSENLTADMLQELTTLNNSITDNDNNIVLIGKLRGDQ
jgi:hypothetical protein